MFVLKGNLGGKVMKINCKICGKELDNKNELEFIDEKGIRTFFKCEDCDIEYRYSYDKANGKETLTELN